MASPTKLKPYLSRGKPVQRGLLLDDEDFTASTRRDEPMNRLVAEDCEICDARTNLTAPTCQLPRASCRQLMYRGSVSPAVSAASPVFQRIVDLDAILDSRFAVVSTFQKGGPPMRSSQRAHRLPAFWVQTSAALVIGLLAFGFTARTALGTFTPHTDFVVGTYPHAIAVVDFNGDGRPDLVAANDGGNSVSVLLNTTTAGATTPTFGPRTDVGAGNRPYWVIAADLNADGRPDLVTANIDSATISVRLNTTAAGAMTPTVGALTSFAAGAQPTSLAAADINGDGKPDLVVANEGNHDTISVLLDTTPGGAGTPSFGAPTTFAVSGNPYAITATDINADGKVDVVVANAASSTLSVLLNTTAPGASLPTFRPKADFGVALLPRSVAAADLNGDGKPDLMTTGIGTHTISVLLNTTAAGATTPSFSPRADFGVAREPWGVVAADTSGDGKPDLVSANSGADTVSVLVNTMTAGAATPSFSSRTDVRTGGGPYSVAAADLNADGRLDLATVNGNSRTGNTVSVLLNLGDSPPPGTPTPPPSGTNLVANPSFEAAGSTGEPTFWFRRQRATQDTSIRHSGNASLRLEGPASGSEVLYTFQRPTVQAGQTYQLTAWVKTDNVSGVGVRVRYAQLTPVVRVWNSSTVNDTIDWTQVSQQFTLPADFASGRLDVYWNMRPGDRAWVDDVALTCLTCP